MYNVSTSPNQIYSFRAPATVNEDDDEEVDGGEDDDLENDGDDISDDEDEGDI